MKKLVFTVAVVVALAAGAAVSWAADTVTLAIG